MVERGGLWGGTGWPGVSQDHLNQHLVSGNSGIGHKPRFAVPGQCGLYPETLSVRQ